MRRVALLGVLAGCNQIYGLESTKVVDAAPDAAWPTATLTYLVAATANIEEGAVATAPIAPSPQPRLAALDAALTEVEYAADGTIRFPPGLLGQPWRLEYTPPNEPPHEVQWQAGDAQGRMVVPLFGRVERTRAPANTGFVLELWTGTPEMRVSWFNPRIYTTGYWTSASGGSNTTQPTYDLHATPPASGDFGSLAAGDAMVVVDYTSDGTCVRANQAGTLAMPVPEPGVMVTKRLVRDGTTALQAPQIAYVDDNVGGFLRVSSRLDQVLGSRSGTEGSRAVYARVAHTQMPAFTEQYQDVPAPLMLELANCPATASFPATIFYLESMKGFPERMFVYASNDRVVSNVRLRSSLAAIAAGNAQNVYELTFPVQLATAPKLGAHDLETEADGDEVGLTGPVDLTFDLETPGPENPSVDYFEVVLYKLAGSSLVPVRIYVGPDPSKRTIRIDHELVEAGTEHVFAIRTYRGRPAAKSLDFMPVAPPHAVATIFTRTFRR